MTTNTENMFIYIEDNKSDYPLIFTRYLYSKEDVLHSLFIALLDKQTDEALFWAYELYYSGFQEETLEILLKHYHEIYENQNSKSFKTFIINQYNSWVETKKNFIIGTIVWNLCNSKYNLHKFVQLYFKKNTDKMKQKETLQKPNKLRLIMGDNDIEQYKTLEHSQGMGCKVLPYVCKYQIHREVSNLFEATNINFVDEYYYNWLYYSYFSPIWKERLSKYNYRVCNETKKIIMNDDDEDDFYSLYSYIPDEQTRETQQMSLGNNIEQMNIEDFCNKYFLKQ
jgi:hypothetical protein